MYISVLRYALREKELSVGLKRKESLGTQTHTGKVGD